MIVYYNDIFLDFTRGRPGQPLWFCVVLATLCCVSAPVLLPLPLSYNTPVRLWTLHPKYLDTKGLLALWREALLAQKVLAGQTVGYRNHPQLRRFQAHADPVAAIATYLHFVYREAVARGYAFNREKIQAEEQAIRMVSTQGQLIYEWEHLKQKLQQRDTSRYEAVTAVAEPEANPIFDIIAGGIESWEVGSNRV